MCFFDPRLSVRSGLLQRCLGQLLLLLLLLLLNHQDRAERRHARLLRSAIARSLPAPPSGTSWSEVSRWVNHTLVPHLHRSPLLSLVGSPRLRDAAAAGRLDTRRLTFAELSAWDWSPEPYVHPASSEMRCCSSLNWFFPLLFRVHTVSLDFTHHHREAAVLVCVSLTLSRAATHTLDVSISARPLLLPPSSGPDLQTLLAVTHQDQDQDRGRFLTPNSRISSCRFSSSSRASSPYPEK